MSEDQTQRLHPVVFVAAGVVVFGLFGFGIDTLLMGTGIELAAKGPFSTVTSYNFTVWGAIAGGVCGGFAGYGLV